jgi:hypothetical protein
MSSTVAVLGAFVAFTATTANASGPTRDGLPRIPAQYGYLLPQLLQVKPFTRLVFVYTQRVPRHEHRHFSLTLEYSAYHGGDVSWQYSSP